MSHGLRNSLGQEELVSHSFRNSLSLWLPSLLPFLLLPDFSLDHIGCNALPRFSPTTLSLNTILSFSSDV